MSNGDERHRVQHPGGGESRVKSADAHRVDLVAMVERMTRVNAKRAGGKQLMFGNFEDAVDLHTHMNRVREVEHDFMELPAKVRKACENDPVRFLEMVSDPEQRHALEELGLVERMAPPSAPPAQEPTPDPGDPPTGEGA